MKRNQISVFIDQESGSEFSKLPKKLQKIIIKTYEEEETFYEDNLPGDNHSQGYSFF